MNRVAGLGRGNDDVQCTILASDSHQANFFILTKSYGCYIHAFTNARWLSKERSNDDDANACET